MRYVRKSFDTPNVMQQDQNVRINYKNSVTTTTTTVTVVSITEVYDCIMAICLVIIICCR